MIGPINISILYRMALNLKLQELEDYRMAVRLHEEESQALPPPTGSSSAPAIASTFESQYPLHLVGTTCAHCGSFISYRPSYPNTGFSLRVCERRTLEFL